MPQREPRTRDGRDARRLAEAQRDWTTLGARDAFWAVLTIPGKRDGAWEPLQTRLVVEVDGVQAPLFA